jgi:hypothetical protein
MTPENRQSIISTASTLWHGNDKKKSIDTLFEAIPIEKRPEWLSRIILSVQALIPASVAIDNLLNLAEQDVDWHTTQPHEILYAVADIADQHPKSLVGYVHSLAYYGGKQIVNAKAYPYPFDHSNLFLIPEVLEEIATFTPEPEQFLVSMWGILSNPEFIQLDEPVMCNSNCVLCMVRFGKISFNQKA